MGAADLGAAAAAGAGLGWQRSACRGQPAALLPQVPGVEAAPGAPRQRDGALRAAHGPLLPVRSGGGGREGHARRAADAYSHGHHSASAFQPRLGHHTRCVSLLSPAHPRPANPPWPAAGCSTAWACSTTSTSCSSCCTPCWAAPSGGPLGWWCCALLLRCCRRH